MRRAWRRRGLLAAAMLALACPGADDLLAQRRPQVRDRTELEQRVRARFDRMIRERLGLDDAGAARLGEVLEPFETRRRELRREEIAVRRATEAMGRRPDVDPAEARRLLDRMLALRVREVQLMEAERDALLEVLTPAQVLRLYVMRDQLGRAIRNLQNRRRGGRDGDVRGRRRGGSPGGWR